MILKIGNKPYELATKEEVMKEVIKEMEDTKKEVFDKLYPVGSVYISLDATFNPNNIYNGKWELIKEGIFLEATQQIGQVGKEIEAGIPDLSGQIEIYIYKPHYISNTKGVFEINLGGSFLQITDNSEYARTGFVSLKASRSSPVYGKSNTVQPNSIRCYMWKRVE